MTEDLKYARKACGLSARELAELSGVHENAIYGWESGIRRNPDPAKWNAVARILGLPEQDEVAECDVDACTEPTSERSIYCAEHREIRSRWPLPPPAIPDDPDPDWRDKAACLGMDTELFFSGRGVPVPIETIEACSNCDVRGECLLDAWQNDAMNAGGIWGGANYRTRIQWKKNLRWRGAA